MPRRRQSHGLERVLGAPALFATAYGNVGSSIYYALGLTAGIALGLTPIVFIISGIIFAATAATYAEGTVRYPEAGGSASFARHAFNEVVSFGAAWAQMLNYVITVAISVIFVPHYLSIFWAPLKTNPWDIIIGICLTWLLVAVNIVGVQEAAKLNIVLAVVDFATQLLLVGLGFFLIFSPSVLLDNVHWGVAPTWSAFLLAIPVAMIAYTGIETVSNLAEEARDPVRSIPRAISWVAIAVFAIYFTLPWIAMSAMPVLHEHGKYVTQLGQDPPHGFKNDPVLGLVENLGLHGIVLQSIKVYVGILAATILFIATNAGVIGASRITYSMASYRQLPSVFRRLHPKLKTPWLSLVVFAGFGPTLFLLAGQVDFLGRMYAFGAMLSFTIAHASVTALRVRKGHDELEWRAWPNVRIGGFSWPVFAIVGGLGTGVAWLVVVVQDAPTRYAGMAWLAAGFVFYVLYRRRLGIPLSAAQRAPIPLGPALALEYRSILVPIVSGEGSREAVEVAARLATERAGRIVLLRVIVVPLELPLDADLREELDEANGLLDEARAIATPYGVRNVERVVRARNAGRAIVDEAERRGTEIIVLGAPRGRHRHIFGHTVDFVLKNAPCRVMVAAGKTVAV
ncbi:MAG: universal stress protein [Actinobacteria bacterium]|nr:universal stress protein [Actinomycetota bacterium]